MDAFDIATFAIRAANAVIWSVVSFKIISHDIPVTRLVRRIVLTVVVFGMWVFVVGSTVRLGWAEPEAATMVYTIFTAYAALIGLGIATGPWHD